MTPKIKRLAALLLSTLVLSPSSFSADRPNLLFILIDDMPYAALSAMGNDQLQTPHLDRLAKEGMTFTRAYSEVLCSPSRSTILTGQWSARHGRTDVAPGVHPHALMKEPELPMPVTPDSHTLVKALRAGGYHTGISGKWHLPQVIMPANPALAGSFGFNFVHSRLDPAEPYKHTQHFTSEALRFLKEAPTGKPFFLYLPYQATHGPHIVPPADLERWTKKLTSKNTGWTPELLATLEFLDRSIGRVLDTLDERGLAENTVVLFASDNGGGSAQIHPEVNKPLRSGKGTLYEGGIRVPFIVRWPGKIVPGSRCDTPVHFVDLYPTLADLAGLAQPPGHTLDGTSLRPLFTGGTLPERTLFFHYPHYLSKWGTTPVRAVVQDRWKLVWNPHDHILVEGPRVMPKGIRHVVGERVELFDLQADPGETKNLAASQPEKVAELKTQFTTWLKSTQARDVTPNPAYDAAKVLFNSREAKE